MAHANHRAGADDDDEDVPRARLVFVVVVVAGVRDAYARASAEKMAVKITAMSVHTSRVVGVVMSDAPVDECRASLTRAAAETISQ